MATTILVKNVQVTWSPDLPTDRKLEFLRSYFNSTLDKVPFWKLYKAVKSLHS